MNDILEAIKFLKRERASIIFEGEDDEGAAEWYAHLSDVISALEKNKMTLKEASDSLGMTLKKTNK